MECKSLYVTVTAECEDLSIKTFPRGLEWELIHEQWDEDGNLVCYEWNGDMQSVIEQNLNTNSDVIEYQIV